MSHLIEGTFFRYFTDIRKSVTLRLVRTRRLKVGGALAGATVLGALVLSLVTASGASRWRPTADDALSLAFAQVGVAENASGGGTIYQKWFVSSPWAVRGAERDGGSVGDYANASWCDMFVSWIGDQLGVRGMGVDAFTPKHAQWFEDRGRWGQTPMPGAVVFFSWSGGRSLRDIDHVGMVVRDNHDGTIETVEGNTGNAVRIRTRDVSNVVGYGYPDYAPGRSRSSL